MLRRILFISLGLFSLFLLTCKDESDLPVGINSHPPVLSFSPDTLRFTVPGDTLSPALKVAKILQIWNEGNGSLHWSLWEDIPWLTMSYSSGVCGDDIDLIDVFAWFDLIDGGDSLRGDIVVSDGTQADTIHAIAVNNNVAQICADVSLLEFIADDDPGPKVLQVRACGSWETHWKARSNTSWVQVSPDSGSSTGEWVPLTITIDWSAIEGPKSKVGSITLDGPNDIDIEIRVSWPVSPALAFSPDTLRFTIPGDTLDPQLRVAKAIQIWNTGSGYLSWSLSEDIDWLTLSSDYGVSSGDPDHVEVLAWFGMIGSGKTLSGDIFITAGTKTDTIHAIAANNTIEEKLICTDNSVLEFIAMDDPGPKILQLRACSHLETPWSAQSNTAWVEVLPGSGISAGEWDSLTVTVDWSAIVRPQTQVGSITLSGPSNDIDIEIHASWPELRLCVDREIIYLDEDTNPGPGEFLVKNCRSDINIDWTASVDKPWVSLSPTSGTSFGEWDSVTVSIDWSFDWTTTPTTGATLTVEGGVDPVTLDLVVFPNCRLSFTEPKALTQWTCGNSVTIRWTKVSAGDWVTLHLYKGTQFVKDLGWGPVEPVVSNTGEHLWMVTTHGLPSGSDYRLRISAADFDIQGCADYSEYFTITVPDCYVWVFDPNVFSGWESGQTRWIRWSTNASAVEVSVDLYSDGVFMCNIIPATENDGIFEWIVADCGGGAGKYQVKVTDTADSSCNGFSEYFCCP